MQIKLIKRKIYIQFTYNKVLVEEIKNSLPNPKFDWATKTWEISVKHYKSVKAFGKKHLASFDHEFLNYQDNLPSEIDHSLIAEQFKQHGINNILRPFQTQAAEFLILNPKSFLALPCGTGKTLTSLAAANMFDEPWLIVTKATLKYNWQREIARWLPHKTINIIFKKNQIIETADFTIINYDLLDSFKDRFNFKHIIFDECHSIKNVKSKRTKAALEICKHAEHVYMLSGTPIINRPYELVTQLKAIDRLHEFGGAHRFGINFANGHRNSFGWDFSGASNLDLLYDKLKTLMFRATKEELLPELPPKQKIPVYLDLSNRKEYFNAEKNLVKYLQKQTADKQEFIASISHLPQDKYNKALHAWKQLHEHDKILAEQLVRIEALKKLCVEGKMGAAIEWINDFLEGDEKLVVFAHHKEVQNALCQAFPLSSVHILGEDSLADRDAAIQKFQNDGSVRLIICSLKAASEGITLTAASNVAFLEFAWTPAEMLQASDRLHRLGQTADSVNIFYLIADKTIDNEILELLNSKESIVNNIVDGVSSETSNSILEDLIDKMVQV